jgi:hypothetical protein
MAALAIHLEVGGRSEKKVPFRELTCFIHCFSAIPHHGSLLEEKKDRWALQAFGGQQFRVQCRPN